MRVLEAHDRLRSCGELRDEIRRELRISGERHGCPRLRGTLGGRVCRGLGVAGLHGGDENARRGLLLAAARRHG